MKKDTKIVKLQVSRKNYEFIEVKDDNELKLIEELNRDFYRFEKSQERLRRKSVSCDNLLEDYKYEIPSIENDPFEKVVIVKRNKALYDAINSLEEIEKKIFILRASDEMSFNSIANSVNLSKTAVIKKYNAIILKLHYLLKDYM